MKKIDLTSWPRKQHFEFFQRIASPMYNTCFDVDITNVRTFARANQLSFNAVMVHVTMTALNQVENLRYRLQGNDVVLHEIIHPVFAHIRKGEDLFGLVVQEYETDAVSFAKKAKQQADAMDAYFPLDRLAGRDDFAFISALPWITFTGIDHTASDRREDAIPRISWGKFREVGDRLVLPYNIQVNHMFVDGIHVGGFKDALDNIIHAL